MKRARIIAVIEAFFAVLAWGASFVATKVALRDISPITVVWLRFAIGVVILGIAVVWRKQFALPGKKELSYLALLGFLGIAFHQWLQSTGLLTAQATTTSWIVATTPIFMALVGWLLLGERLSLLQGAGVFAASLGVLLVVSKGDLASLSVGKVGTVGDVLILVSALNWAVFSALSRSGLQRHPATRMMFYVMGFGWMFSSILFFSKAGLADIRNLTLDGWLGVGFLGVFCSGLAYIFWYDALKTLPVAQTGSFIYLEPLVTIVIAAWILSEPLIPASLVGGGLILMGVYIVNTSRTS